MTAQPLIIYEAGPNWRGVADPVDTAPEPVRTIVKGMTNLTHKLAVGDVDDIPSQVKNWRKAHGAVEISSIDLVAHSTAGRVSVGFSTRNFEVGTTGTDVSYFVLDTNPKVYRVLSGLQGEVDAKIPLRLLGCNTATVVEGYGLDGRILLIALANMLDCAVDGTVSPIGVSDFGPDGFISPSALARVEGGRCVPVRGPFDPETCCQPAPPQPGNAQGVPTAALRASSVVSSAALEVSSGARVGAAMVDPSWVRGLLAQFATEGKAYSGGDGLLALVDVTITLPNRQRLELLDTGRLLRWRRPEGTVLFEASRGAAGELRPDLARVLGVHAPWWSLNPVRRGA